ncbi:MAG: hypothetical protein HZR80_01545 [Candidatus Heimdallarchaeota archaeon]
MNRYQSFSLLSKENSREDYKIIPQLKEEVEFAVDRPAKRVVCWACEMEGYG